MSDNPIIDEIVRLLEEGKVIARISPADFKRESDKIVHFVFKDGTQEEKVLKGTNDEIMGWWKSAGPYLREKYGKLDFDIDPPTE